MEAATLTAEERNAIVEANMGLVWSVVYSPEFIRSQLPEDDRAQAGTLGLMRAVDLYDESFGTQLSTYAVPWIRAEIRKAISMDASIYIPLWTGYRKSRESERASTRKILAHVEAMSGVLSLDHYDGDPTIGREDHVATVDDEDETAWLRAKLERLPQADRELLDRRFGGEIARSIAASLGMSKHGVEYRVARAVARLRKIAFVGVEDRGPRNGRRAGC